MLRGGERFPMIDLYAWMTPNGFKITIALEEMDVPYTLKPVDLGESQNKASFFKELNPNQKIPVIVDHSPKKGGPVTLWESGAILLYLAEKEGKFLPKSGLSRAQVFQWLMFQMSGVGPYFGNTFHFHKVSQASSQNGAYGLQRFLNETNRLCGVLDQHLSKQDYLSKSYSIADIALYPWIRSLKPLGVSLDPYLNLKRWYHMVDARPNVQKGMIAFKALGLPKKKNQEKAKKQPKDKSQVEPKKNPVKEEILKKVLEKANLATKKTGAK